MSDEFPGRIQLNRRPAMLFALNQEIYSRLIAKKHIPLPVFIFIQTNRDGILTLGKWNVGNHRFKRYGTNDLFYINLFEEIKYFSKVSLFLVIKRQMHFRPMHRLMTYDLYGKN